MPYRPTLAAFNLLLEGQQALCEVQRAGIRIDRDQLQASMDEVDSRSAGLRRRLEEDEEIYPIWRKEFGDQLNFNSGDQLRTVLFQRVGFKSKGKTAKGGKDRTDKEALEYIALEKTFVRNLLHAQSLDKVKSTFLKGIEKELVRHADGLWYVHPSFNLNLAQTYRTSSSNFNFQNLPVRNDELAGLIRKCFVPRPGRHIGELDFSQIEIRVAACYTKDPKLIEYLENPKSDMHRDAACDAYFLKKNEVSKEARHSAKNMFVFPQFYGSVYFQCAPFLWDAVTRRNLKTLDGSETLADRLRKNGIVCLGDPDPQSPRHAEKGTFIGHMKSVEEKFWARLKVYTECKKRWVEEYRKTGGMKSFTGFAWNGQLRRNQILNFRIQCDASQCKLRATTLLIRQMRKAKMKSKVLGEIHDSIVIDFHPAEMQDVLTAAHNIMTVRVPREWEWIIVPLETESEVAPRGRSWHEKAPWVFEEGSWRPKLKS